MNESGGKCGLGSVKHFKEFRFENRYSLNKMKTIAVLSNSFSFMDRPFLAYVIKIILFMITTVDTVNSGKTKNAENLHFY